MPRFAPAAASGGAADMRPCARCGVTDPRRMYVLMSLWFARAAGLTVDAGYFHLCPRCYGSCIAPHEHDILHRLAVEHPGRRRPGQNHAP